MKAGDKLKRYTPKEFGNEVGVTYQTLIEWEKQGKIVADRTADGRRYYTEQHLRQYFGEQYMERKCREREVLFCLLI